MAGSSSRIPQGAHLVYFADPMCSWCWGFAPTIRAITAHWGPALPVRLIMGGLRPGTTQAMTPEHMAATREHWENVARLSGQPFDLAFFERERFVYDTEPACRAVVTMLFDHPDKGLPMLERIQRAFYAENGDTTDPETLAGLAAEFGVSVIDFQARLESQQMKAETRLHFEIAINSGVRAFPTLIGGIASDRAYTPITQGFVAPDRAIETIEAWLKTIGQTQALHS